MQAGDQDVKCRLSSPGSAECKRNKYGNAEKDGNKRESGHSFLF